MKWRLQRFGPRPKLWHLRCRTVVPHRWEGPNTLRMGSYGPDGRLDPETALFRRYHPRKKHQLGQAYNEIATNSPRIASAVFAGPLFPAFGHFLLESLARLWAVDRFPDRPILWSVGPGAKQDSLHPWMRDILDLLGVTNPILMINSPIIVDELIVPAPGYEIQYRFGAHHFRFLGKVNHKPEPNRKLWLSRAGVEEAENTGRTALEESLTQRGWEVMRPETMTIRDQMEALSCAERIAGEQGSALHSLILLRRPKRLRLDVFARDPALDGHAINANQHTICARLGIDYRLHRMAEESVEARKGTRVTKTYGPPEAYLNRLD
ncbi:glycosyltransferase family 61 protein [Roseicyclus marinus]|uniref:glycosyltransferase family 61 protein n=1 Tax=Roseicyclus marinus TaxID=2161673 RepID=UPI002410AF54|nr:glycosyltransferase 61 family protein [Roseicyclus marinus]MDG3043061.1 glycosyltransferase 61 family protein [Roseicyclus marinus]